MADSLFFKSGILELSTSPLPQDPMPVTWADVGINRILVIAAILLLIASLNTFLRIFPNIVESLRWSRGCLRMEHSYNMMQQRNVVAVSFIPMFCLIVDRFDILPYLSGLQFPSWAGSLAVFCVISVFCLLRRIVHFIHHPGEMESDCAGALLRTIYTVFIVLCIVMLASVVICHLFSARDDVCRRVMLVEMAFFYLFSLLRSIQFLSSRCNGFATILYLCALEILPAAAVVLACVFLKL